MKIVFIIWLAAALAVLSFGLFDLRKIVASLAWLKLEEKHSTEFHKDPPFIIILLPVLREQRIITDTLHIFANLKYPLQCMRVFVITTEKEYVQLAEHKDKLISLARDLASKRFSTTSLIERYLGVLPEDVLKKIIAVARLKSSVLEIHSFLLEVFNANPTTIDLVKENIAALNERIGMPFFIHLHYPGTGGNMGEQLKYALDQLPLYLVGQSISKSDSYLAIYNADSRPHVDTMQNVARLCSSYHAQHNFSPPVIQQSAMFLENANNLGSSLKGLLLQSAAILQTRWVLSHELPRLRRQSYSALQFQCGKLGLLQRLSGAEFALCVGHGLFLRYDLAEELDIFSTGATGDDLLWSFRLCIEHVPMLPLPLLESGESPTTVTSLIVQKKNWFLGYTSYFRCRKIALQTDPLKKSTVELVTWHGILRAVKWLFLSPTLLLTFVLPILMNNWQMLLVTFAIFAIYEFTTYSVILVELGTLKRRSGGIWSPFAFSKLHRVCLVIFSVPAFLIESVGLWWCLLQCFGCAISGIPVRKQKTER